MSISFSINLYDNKVKNRADNMPHINKNLTFFKV